MLMGGLVFAGNVFAGGTVWRVIGTLMQPQPPIDSKDDAFIDEDVVRKADQIGFWIQFVNDDKLKAGLADKESSATKNFWKLAYSLAADHYAPPLLAELKEGTSATTVHDLGLLYLYQEVAANTLSYEVKIKTYMEVNCTARSMRTTAVYFLDKSASGYGSSSFPDAAFSPIPPDSLADKARRWFCK